MSPAITEAFRRRADGVPIRGKLSVPRFVQAITPYGNRYWTDSTVQRILRNPVYLGEVRHGAFINAEAHQPLIAALIWQRAQAPRFRRPTPAHRRPSLWPGCCGAPVVVW